MQRIYFLFVLSFTTFFCFSQQTYKVTYGQLKEFEGLYEYTNNGTLKIAASPKDTLLYAVINESKYRLMPSEKDVFLNMSNERVQFFRNTSNAIAGYIVGKDSFKLLSTNVFFPETIWYPRLSTAKNFDYKYQEPKDYKDGLRTGTIQNSGLDTALLSEMMRKIIDGTYPNVHSVLIIKDGKLLFEEYFYEYNKDSLQELRSASKSFISALTGIAIEKRFIKSKNETMLSYFPEYNFKNNSEAKRRITIENLLTNQSGLDCDISDPKSEGNETTMANSDDWIQFTLDLPMVDTPGGKGMYCSGNPVTLGRIVEKATQQSLPDFAKANLFSPLNISTFKWSLNLTSQVLKLFASFTYDQEIWQNLDYYILTMVIGKANK